MPLAKERLDRVVNIILRIHPTRQHLLMPAQMLVQDINEISGAISTGHLAIPKQIARRQELFLENLDTIPAIRLGTVIPIRKVEQINIPLIRRVMRIE